MNNKLFDIFSKNNENNFGFYFSENRIKFYIPFIFDDNSDNIYHLLKRYNKILNKYIHSKNTEVFSNNKNNEIDIKSLNIIEAYLNLLDDWHNNNDFLIFKKDYKNKNRSIDWNKTFKKNEVIFSKNNIVYGDLISYKKSIDNDNKFFSLYCEGMKQAKEIFLQIKSEDVIFPSGYNEQKYHLYKYAESHFKDREIFICKNLISIFLQKEDNNLKDNKFEEKYHTDFEFIWENIINNITRSKHVDKRLKKGVFERNNEIGINLRIDTLLKDEDLYFILDSKFYQSYNQNFKMPDTRDIVKQFGYKLFLNKLLGIPEEKIINLFIFPKNTENKEVEIFNKHYINGDNNGYFTIYCIAVDINKAMDFYINEAIYQDLIDKVIETAYK